MQLEFFDVPSPCIGICQSDDKGQCIGCFRTRDERQTWTTLSTDNKQKVVKRCIQRKKRKENKQQIKNPEEVITAIQPSLLDTPAKTLISVSSDLDFGDFEL